MIHLTGQQFSPKEIIQQIFSPMIGVVCSPQAEEICQKNNLSFVELLQPFSKLSTDANFRDPSGGASSIKGIRLNVCDVGWRPPQTVLAKKLLTESVASFNCDKTKHIHINETTELDIPSAQPWYEQWRETFLSVQFPADHEFTRHFLSCLIVLSSSDPNPLESANNLTRKVQMMQNVTPQKLPKWLSFGTEILNSYVMLHDGCQGDITKAQQAFETLKLTFGENKCFLLQINSYQGTTPGDCTDPWMKFLKKHPKSENQSDQNSAPKTPQDIAGVTSMPTCVLMSSLESPQSGITNEELVDHPLSPVQEHATEAIHSNFSTSCDSLTSQVVNPNVWANETDTELPHGMWLTASDVDNLKHFIQDYTIRSLIPYIERMVAVLNDAVMNKKGVSRSLLSATKRWFVTNKPGVNTMQNAVVYTNDSIELQTRKLGDLYFMFGNYNLAFQAYHQAKRDFNADSAWQYYAGALEMAAMAAFMLGTSSRKTYDYMEEAIVTYLNICKLPQFATRATLISIECLKNAKLFGEAAKQLIRMTSEDSDLRSALLLEEASYSYLMSQPPLFRKYAFHIVLAGHRYSKCGQRKHAFRCYKQAYQVFENRGWSLAEDHIQYTIGKQAVTLKKLDEASSSLAHLLRPSSLQSCNQQAAFLREYIATQKTLLNQSDGELLLDISLPKIVHNLTRVLVTSHPPVTIPNLVAATNIQINSNLEDEWKWQKLEEIVVQVASNKPLMLFKPTRSLFTSAVPTLENPICIHGEPIEISFTLENTIKPSVTFEDINLLWTFTKENGEVETNAVNGNLTAHNIITSSYIKTIQLNEYDKKMITLNLIPHFTGTLKITGIFGKISATNEHTSLNGKLDFEPILIRPDGPSAQDKQPQYDKKLEIIVLPAASALHVSFSTVPEEVIAGEIIPITLHLTNSGSDPLGSLYAATESPRWILGELDGQELPLSVLRDFTDLTNEALSRDKEFRKQHSFCLLKSFDNGIALNPQETKTTTIWLQAPMKKGRTDIKLLIYYAMPNGYPRIKYRLVRHVWQLNVNESLCVGASCSIGNMTSTELGIDINIKNLNQVHHPLMTEIMLNDISLYSPTYQINPKKVIYMQSPGLSRVFDENSGLRSNERIDLRFSLNEYQNVATTDPTLYIKDRLSQLNIVPSADIDSAIPNLAKIGSFLMKNETKYIGVLGQTGNNEDFNNIVSNEDRHLCVILTWKAIVHDNSSLQRLAFGQHFVQLRNLYETVYCPNKEKMPQTTFCSQEELYSIFDFKNQIQTNQWVEDVDDDWEYNDVSVTANFRDPSGGASSIKGIRLNVCDVGWRPPQTVLAKKMLTESVASFNCDKTKHIHINETTELDIPSAQPWYEQWRETFLSVQFPADHEFTRHFLSCLIVLSSSDPNPLESANNLTRKVQMLQNVTPQKLPKWLSFGTEILNSYVMLHDGCQGDIIKAQQAFETLKLTFGENKCFLLQINSYQGTTPGDCTDPWMKFLKKHPKSNNVLRRKCRTKFGSQRYFSISRRYRLVGHVWQLNVNESLCVGASCSIGNMTSTELGIDINIKTLNQVHHPLMTEIMLNDISLYSPTYQINPKKVIYMQSPGLSRVFDENSGLRSNERIDLRFSLNEYQNVATTDPTLYIEDRLSQLNIVRSTDIDSAIPNLAKIGSFLMKNETK